MISGVSSAYSGYSCTSNFASKARPPAGDAPDPAKFQAELFSKLDSNSDGGIGKDELTAAVSAAQESDSSLEIDIDELFSQLDGDGDGDGSISEEESAALAPPPPPPHGGPNPEELFAQLDSDSDGSVSLDELTSAIESAQGTSGTDLSELFAALDTDEDGSLSLEESAALAPPPPPPPGEFSNSQGTYAEADTSSTQSSSDEAYGNLVANLLKHYQAGAASYSSRLGSQLNLSA